MDIAEFQKMKEIETGREDLMDDMEVGDKFLYGKNVVAQKQNKQAGQPISYYVVVDKKGSTGVVYTAVFDTLDGENLT